MRLTLSIALLLCGCGDVIYVYAEAGVADLSVPPSSTVLADTVTLTNCLALDTNNVYWTESSSTVIPDAGALGRLMKVSKMGGNPTLLLDGVDAPGCAVTDDQNVYVTRGGDLVAVPLGGGNPMVLAQNQHVLPGSTPRLAAHGGFVYWITDVYGAVDAFNGKNALVRVSTAGGTPETLFNDLNGSPGGIAVDAMNVYYSTLDGMFVRSLAGGAASTLGLSVLHNNRFAIDDLHLALNEEAGIDQMTGKGMGDVAVMGLDGSNRKVVQMQMATSLAIDHSDVYGSVGGKLTRFPIDGDGTKSETLDERGPRAIAIDAANVYYTDGSSILRFAK